MVNPELDCIFHLFVNDLSTFAFPDGQAREPCCRLVHGKKQGPALRERAFCYRKDKTHKTKTISDGVVRRSHGRKATIKTCDAATPENMPGASAGRTAALLATRHQTCIAIGHGNVPQKTIAKPPASPAPIRLRACRTNLPSTSTDTLAQPFREQGRTRKSRTKNRCCGISKRWLQKWQVLLNIRK